MTTEQRMQRAIDLAQSVLTASPNPRVGCVIVRDGEVVGEGWHVRPGEAHAEVNALAMAGSRAAGATVYVSLEPCAHTGKTPPCADALIRAGVAEVIYASSDPNPLVAGKGLERLRQAGIRVSGPVLQDRADAINPGFIKRMTQGLPWVRCKMAMSLDGRTAMASGESKWITGTASRADVQRMRASSCAVVTGVNTVISDDPGLNVRAEQWQRITTQKTRADINDHFVDQPGLYHRATERRPGFQHHLVAAVVLRQTVHGSVKIHAPAGQHGQVANLCVHTCKPGKLLIMGPSAQQQRIT